VSAPASGFAIGLAALASASVDFVVVGVGAINFYARDPGLAFGTLDLDLFLRPDLDNLRSALAALAARGFRFEGGGEPFVDSDDETVLSRVIEQRATLRAVHSSGAPLDLMLSLTGFAYEEIASDAREFRVGDVSIHVAALAKLLRSKELSGRAKDRAFLEAFLARAENPGD
jgi:hypothetical protein